ncbi:MAG: SDR family oxidoreductase [Bacteroidota bacterium]|nr:SDR family oxidoreductase [Bacteroidota bacterium]
MKEVCVITGGGSGMGFAAAKTIGKKGTYIIIVGRTLNKLERALKELRNEEIEAEAFACDISNRGAVDELVARASEVGIITSVIHAAGLSPNMGDAKTIMEANALGTINMNEAFYKAMHEDSCMIDVSSMSAYLIPSIVIPRKKYKYSRIDKDLFIKKMMSWINLFPKKLRAGVAYGISKNFVIWYAKTDALKFGMKGIRIISISPGSFETPMGELEKDRIDEYTKNSAIPRPGKVEEIAQLFEFCVSPKASYLTGVDILCDGGCVASREGAAGLRKKGIPDQ